jgi:hypothetical protein
MRTAWVLAVVLLASNPASASTCSTPSGSTGTLESVDAEVRLAFLKHQLHSQASRSVLWMGLWGSAYGLISTGTMAVTPLVDDETKKDLYVGAAASLVGALRVLLLPPRIIAGVDRLERELSSVDDVCEQLSLAERALVRFSEDQRNGRRWYLHALNVAFNVGLGLLVGVGFGHWTVALLRTVMGVAVGEALIFTRPAALPEVQRRYLSGHLNEGPGFFKAQWPPSLSQGQLGVAFSF